MTQKISTLVFTWLCPVWWAYCTYIIDTSSPNLIFFLFCDKNLAILLESKQQTFPLDFLTRFLRLFRNNFWTRTNCIYLWYKAAHTFQKETFFSRTFFCKMSPTCKKPTRRSISFLHIVQFLFLSFHTATTGRKKTHSRALLWYIVPRPFS